MASANPSTTGLALQLRAYGLLFLRPAYLRATTTLVLGVIIARELGAAEFGLFASAVAIVLFLGAAAGLGLDPAVAEDYARKPEESTISLGTCMALRLAAAALGYALLFVLLRGAEPSLLTVWLVGGLTLFLQAPLSVSTWLCARGEMGYARFADHAGFLLSAVLRVGLIVSHAPAIWFAALLAVESTLIALILFYAHGKIAPADEAFGWDFERAKTWLRQSAPVCVAALLAVAILPVNQWLVARLAGAQAAGHYGAPAVLLEFGVFLLGALALAGLTGRRLTAPLSHAAPSADAAEPALLATAKFAWCAALLLCVLAPWVVRFLFGADYAGATLPLRLLAFCLLPLGLGLVRQQLWSGPSGAKRGVLALGIGAGVNLFLALGLISRWGAAGAAVATLISVSLTHVALTFAWKETRALGRQQLRALALIDFWRSFKRPAHAATIPASDPTHPTPTALADAQSPEPTAAARAVMVDTAPLIQPASQA